MRARALVALVALAAIAAGSAGAAPQPPGKRRGGVKLVPVGRFDTPTYVAFSGLRVSHPVSFGEDAAGHLYITTLGGRVFRFKRRR